MASARDPRDRLAVALDVPSLAAAEILVAQLAGLPGWLKVGGELFTAAGPAAIALAAKQARVFLDIKLHDIPNTVAGAVAAAARHGVGMLTLHVAGGAAMLRAARAAADEAGVTGTRPALLGVTVLTSLGTAELRRVGVQGPVEEQVARLVDLALECGLDGVVASPHEAAAVRSRAGSQLTIVTPGVRAATAAPDDQTRTASAADALRAGSDLLVVGRPVVRAADPGRAAREMLREIESALARRGA